MRSCVEAYVHRSFVLADGGVLQIFADRRSITIRRTIFFSAIYVPNANPASLYENRHVNNVGLKGDFTDRINDRNLFKAGYQLQDSIAEGRSMSTRDRTTAR